MLKVASLRLAEVTLGRLLVDVTLNVTELELAEVVCIKLDEGFDFFVERLLVPPGHGDDLPAAFER